MRVLLALCCLFFLLPAKAEARETIKGPLTAQVLQVLDGDTVTVRLRVWLGHDIETRVRIAGMDTPEKHSKCEAERRKAEAARQALAALLEDGKISLSNIRYAKYAGRVLATATTTKGTDIAATLIARGFARPYHGQKRKKWCS